MSLPLEKVTRALFEPHRGEGFRLATPGCPELELVLVEIGDAGEGVPGGREPFSLIFAGPPQPILRQAIHGLVHPVVGRLEIFLVPIGLADGKMRYQAIFS